MKKKTLAATLLLAMVPGLAAADCIGHGAQTMACGDGQVYDADSRTCVPNTTS